MTRQVIEELDHVAPELLGGHIRIAPPELRAHLVEVLARGGQELPHLDTDGVETEVDFLFHVQEDRALRHGLEQHGRVRFRQHSFRIETTLWLKAGP